MITLHLLQINTGNNICHWSYSYHRIASLTNFRCKSYSHYKRERTTTYYNYYTQMTNIEGKWIMIVINLIQMGSYNNNCDYSHSNGQLCSGSSQEVASYCYYGKYSRLYLSPYTEMVNEQWWYYIWDNFVLIE